MDAFDADVLIYAATPEHHLGRRVMTLLQATEVAGEEGVTRIGSVLLLPELLAKPTREQDTVELDRLSQILGRLWLHETDVPTSQLAVTLAAKYRLRAADAIHLATAVMRDADRFVTNNSRDFPRSIAEVQITYPMDLPDISAS
jgi:predicted nucleic acid-binding protein